MLTRQSLAHLIAMYNSIHTGRPIVLLEERELCRLREAGRRADEDRAFASAAPARGRTGRLARLAARLVPRPSVPPAPRPGSGSR